MPDVLQYACNQTWKTKSGRLCLIVNNVDEHGNEQLKMLYYDEIDREYTIVNIYDRLQEKVDDTPQAFFNEQI